MCFVSESKGITAATGGPVTGIASACNCEWRFAGASNGWKTRRIIVLKRLKSGVSMWILGVMERGGGWWDCVARMTFIVIFWVVI